MHMVFSAVFFYGEASFFIPVHQNLVEADLDYFTHMIYSYFK